MRKIEFSELKLENVNDIDTFYQLYLETLNNDVKMNNSFDIPDKQYEIFYLDDLDGKIILLNKDYIQKDDTSNQELFYDYSIAFKVYNLMLDIYDGIDDEKNEFNELYKYERLNKDQEITELKKQDEILFSRALKIHEIIMDSEIYTKYLKLVEENEQLKKENMELKEKVNTNLQLQNNDIGFFEKLMGKLKKKR